ncbi:ABC transporter [Anaerosporomusa subterranea]|uniref:ABC transporter n=1 Tax=Anaerosporomusa subterranea TaxID=1794912 RepID=A0A154BTN9_ANASB|nr:tryptophan transporter [Anaerosporomusa subterranea]KYZ76888.1 ABC transporter [Anaerosporomusa subterranea]
MEQQVQQPTIIVAGKGGKYRWLAITALFLAIGTILRLVSPSVAGVSPNWTIAMYCLAMILVRPSLGQAVGIGLVAGAIALVTSKSPFPYGNLVSEVLGAVTACTLVKYNIGCKIGKLNLQPAIIGLITTLFSGLTFVTLMKIVLGLPMQVYLYGMLPVVFTVAAVNTVVTQVLYFPAYKLFSAQLGISEREKK